MATTKSIHNNLKKDQPTNHVSQQQHQYPQPPPLPPITQQPTNIGFTPQVQQRPPPPPASPVPYYQQPPPTGPNYKQPIMMPEFGQILPPQNQVVMYPGSPMMGVPGAPPPRPPPLIPTQVKGVPPGLDLLLPLNHVFVKQQIEILEVLAHIETANRYDVLNAYGQRIYFAAETTSPVCLACGGSNRPFTIRILDFVGRNVMIADRVDSSCSAEMLVTLADGSKLGEVIQQNCCTPTFDIKDGQGQNILMITGPAGGDCCTGTADYPITTTSGEQIGIIRKTFSGFIQEAFTDADNFGVEFPADLDVKWKALMFAAVFLIDFMYYESTPEQGHHHHSFSHTSFGHHSHHSFGFGHNSNHSFHDSDW